MKFANLILPLALPNVYTYAVPPEYEQTIKIGQRVLVQFGKKKIYSSIVSEVHNVAPENYPAKPILEIIDEHPLLDHHQLQLIKWISDYYMCTQGEILKSAIPAGLRLSSESNVSINPEADIDTTDIDEREKTIVDRLYQVDALTFPEIEKLIGKKNIHKYLKSLLAREYILLFEQVSDRYAPKKISKIALDERFQNEEKISALFEELEKKPKQADWLMGFLREAESDFQTSVAKKQLTSNYTLSTSSLNTLVKNKVFKEFKEVVSRFPKMSSDVDKQIKLSLRSGRSL